MQGWRHFKKSLSFIFPHTVDISVSKKVAFKRYWKKAKNENGNYAYMEGKKNTKVQYDGS